ncbi:MAG: hypothetical protein WCX65_17190, partial [bacterium]
NRKLTVRDKQVTGHAEKALIKIRLKNKIVTKSTINVDPKAKGSAATTKLFIFEWITEFYEI